MPLTNHQHRALGFLRDGENSAYQMKVSLNVLTALEDKGLVRKAHTPGLEYFPRNQPWCITPQGKDAWQEEEDAINSADA